MYDIILFYSKMYNIKNIYMYILQIVYNFNIIYNIKEYLFCCKKFTLIF